MSVSKFDAILSLVGGQLAGDPDGKNINYIDEQKPPSEKAITDEIARLEKEESDNAYKDKRAVAYPSIVDQLDLLWHAIDSGTLDNRDHRNKFYSTLKEVKTNNPKG